MPEFKENLWCVVGNNGVGKSSICDGLDKDPEFERIQRDSRLEGLWNEFGGFSGLVKDLHGERSKRRETVRKLRKKIDNLIRLLTRFEAMSEAEGKTLLEMLVKISQVPDEKLANFYSVGEDTFYYLVRFLAEHQGIEEAIQSTKKGTTNVLLDDPHLLDEHDGKFIQKYFEANGISPSILIVRATKERIHKVAMERFRSSATKGVWKGRAAAAIEQMNQKISCPQERVIVYDNTGSLEDGITTIRKRILAKDFDQNIQWPIPLSLE